MKPYIVLETATSKVDNCILWDGVTPFTVPDGFELMEGSAPIGGYWLESLGVFTEPAPFESWMMNAETGEWEPPVPKPDGEAFWLEDLGEWFVVPNSDYEVE
jgi:hypothetical protein